MLGSDGYPSLLARNLLILALQSLKLKKQNITNKKKKKGGVFELESLSIRVNADCQKVIKVALCSFHNILGINFFLH